MNPLELVQPSRQALEDEDYESDVLEDSSSDEEDHNSKTHDVQDYDDEEYGNFLQSVFCDDDGAKSHFSLTDEEDEEEYRPQHLDSNDDEDYDDDDDDDDGLIKVARRELEDLVDGCWQTVAGEPLQFGPSDCEVSGSQKSRGLKRSRCSFIDASSLSGQESTGTGENSLSHIAGKSSSRPSKLPFPHPNRLNPPPNRVQGQQSGGQSLISNLVRQIFSGEKPSAVCLDGMPVDAIRKLVARQMSMASQLLVQMLLSSEDRSGCFSSCYTSLMELSNQREQALKKAALLQMNMKNLKVAALQKIALLSQQPCLSLDSSPAEMRLTRAVAERQSKAQGSSIRSISLFDVPMLADITELFRAIDLSKREIKAQIALLSITPPSISPHLPGFDKAASLTNAADDYVRSRSYSLIALKTQMQRIASSNSSEPLSTLTKMRVWECLIPTPHSPLGEDMMTGADPSSLMGRSIFTPAEDDLLLRGIIKHGEDSWALIRQHFLPSKEEQLLQFRFRQMTSPAAKEASKFKRYTALEKNCRGRERWTHEEDLDLLRGYQIYGDKWPLISIFFFPHRCRKELKARWQAIQKHWERAFSGNLEHITFKTELNASSKMLLHFLKENSNTVHNTSTSPMRSAAILQYQSVIYPGIDGSSANTTNKCKDDQRCSRDEEGVEEDMLADSDEEDGPKDLDWHLGRLTKRQSVLSQWSRSLSSTAAIYCGGRKSLASSSSSSIRSAKERQTKCQDQGQMKQKQQQQSQSKIAVASANQALQPQRVQEAVSTAALQLPSKVSHLSQHELLQQQRQYQQPEMYREHTMSRKEQSVRGHKAGGNVNLSCSIAGQSYEAAITTEALNLSGSISARERNSTTSSVLENLPRDNFSMDFADSQFEFTNFSNITMILDNARALMDGHNSNSDVINSTTTNYNNNNNNNNNNNIKEYVAPDSRTEGRPLRPTMYEENFSGYRSLSQLATVNDLNGSRHMRQKGSSRIEAVGMCVSKNTRLEPVRGLFAAVMSETNSDRSGPTHHI